ncbi:hypothetical protein GWG65_19675 [Bradyrhizobium sp. CSA207]|uniref:hypothetical protein n=1 Tax=Bradyrhizobium sp. CSA207 TaxID=2698826 RepID=UPI0023B01818|nr:hypothetical protein [Bradyrhizobium sp. CSA207]MDE5443625.1 hypothetical protein [Bradyrhizobium sp. CSA207]
MLEISVFCVMLLAAGYWAIMFVMGRRDDVIHGKFVHADYESAIAQSAMLTLPSPFPRRPLRAAKPPNDRPASGAAKPVTSEALQSLLAAIQQDLKSVA